MNRKLVIAATVVGVLLLAGGFFYWRFTSSPKYALLQISRAVENHDTQTFQQYVDMDHITGNVVDQTISLFSHEQGGGLMAIGAMFMKPQLTELTKQQVLDYVATGSTESAHHSPADNTEFSLGSFLKGTGAGDTQYKGIAYTREEGDVATVGIEFDHIKYDTTMVLDVKMRYVNNQWKVIELSNFAGYMKAMTELHKRGAKKEQ